MHKCLFGVQCLCSYKYDKCMHLLISTWHTENWKSSQCQLCCHWLLVPEIIIVKTARATKDNKVGIMITFGFLVSNSYHGANLVITGGTGGQHCKHFWCHQWCMMMSSNGNIFHVTGPLWGESTSDRWIPLTKASDVELWYFYDLRLNKQLCKQSTRRWFEMPSCSLWRHCNGQC